MKHLRIVSIMTVVLGLTGAAAPAFAREEGACKEDVKKLCGDVKPGGGAIGDCLKTHADSLSPECKENMAEGRKKMKAFQEACQADLKQFCANVTPGEGREFACLHAYSDKISAGCKAAMPKHGMHKGMGMHHGDKDKDDHDEGQEGTSDAK